MLKGCRIAITGGGRMALPQLWYELAASEGCIGCTFLNPESTRMTMYNGFPILPGQAAALTFHQELRSSRLNAIRSHTVNLHFELMNGEWSEL